MATITSDIEQALVQAPVQAPSIITEPHRLGERILLTEKFHGVDTPKRMRGIELFPHQRTIVAAVVDMEDAKVLTIESYRQYASYTTDQAIIQSSALVISEPFGSGKTIEILAVIAVRPVPKAFPTHANSVLIGVPKAKSGVNRYHRRGLIQKSDWFQHEIVTRYTGSDALIKPNLIIVGSAVLLQWEGAIREFTNMKVLCIGNYYDLKKFQKLFAEKKLHAFDIILMKNGTVTGNFDAGDGSTKEYRSLITVMGTITKDSCWSRVIYDDFDTIKIPSGSCALSALSTIYVSATTKLAPAIKAVNVEYTSLVDAFEARQPPLHLILNDSTLFSNFNIRNEAEFAEKSTKVPIIKKWRYVYANPDDNYIRLLGAMGEDDAKNLMEMLNGDAVATAAEALGIKTTSVADIFKRMLDKKYEKFMHDQYVLETIEKVKTDVVPKLEAPKEKQKPLSPAEIEAYRISISKKTVPKIRCYDIKLDQMLDEIEIEYIYSKEQNGLAISRVIDNIKEGSCQICALPLEDMDAFIVRCCGLIVCDICGIKGNQIALKYNYKRKANIVCGSCANCKAEIIPQTDLIFVDQNFDMAALLQSKGDEEPIIPEEPEPEPEPEVIEVTDAEPEITNPKIKALVQIIRGQKPENKESVKSKIKNLLEGRVDIPQTNQTKRKIIVFAGFNETLNNIENVLADCKIEFLRLGGGHKEMDETVRKFKTYGSVLLINSQQHCAGLNLQFCSALVFMHKIIDENVESQVAGRAQRIGRECNLDIHYLCYQNEKNMM
jgi:hypothetical protein